MSSKTSRLSFMAILRTRRGGGQSGYWAGSGRRLGLDVSDPDIRESTLEGCHHLPATTQFVVAHPTFSWTYVDFRLGGGKNLQPCTPDLGLPDHGAVMGWK